MNDWNAVLNTMSRCYYRDILIEEFKKLGILLKPWFSTRDSYRCLNYSDMQHIFQSLPELQKIAPTCSRCRSQCTHVTQIVETTERICNQCIHNYYHWYDGTWHNEQQPEYGVSEYHATPRDDFMKSVNFDDPGLLGIELEIDARIDRDELAERIKACGPILAEDDGSLNDEGIEFIFVPVPLNQITTDSFIGQAIAEMQGNAYGWDAGDGYGMHISINAATMSRLHVGKFCHFIHTNKALCEKVAGRKNNSWAMFDPQKKVEDYHHSAKVKYQAAAIRSKSRIEVRIFRSTIKWERFRRNCEFVDAIRTFTKRTTVDKLTEENFLKYIAKHDQYSLINQFLSPALVAVGE